MPLPPKSKRRKGRERRLTCPSFCGVAFRDTVQVLDMTQPIFFSSSSINVDRKRVQNNVELRR